MRSVLILAIACSLMAVAGCKDAPAPEKTTVEKGDKKADDKKADDKKADDKKADQDKANDKKAEPSKSDKEAAAVAVAKPWLELIDSGKYDESWDQTSSQFRAAVTKDKWPGTIKPVRVPLGKVNKREVKSKTFMTALPGAPDGEYVVIQYATEFENKKTAIETITPKFEGGKWLISGYYIK